ncbi:synaptic vesicle glycoprotein 2A-like [Athalia rosae]|uniref:synaptic vesicle glycoprotein 2A-like n=1 Tax=Athalia rosae TaxID=37344 RepID=UPI0020339256|nr:synaptic vesicle glycoprotein 2A-like [Athalia rosae]
MTYRFYFTVRSFKENSTSTGYGKFHYKLFIVCYLIFMNTGFGTCSTGLIVPVASCDFAMSTMDIGRLTAAPMLGMAFGSYFWACLADIRGRKVALLSALFLDATAGILSSIAPNFWLFVVLRFFNGFAIIGQSAMVFPYLGEFQPSKIREKILAWMEMAWTTGITILPLLGWLIIPMTFNFQFYKFSFASRNLFVLICGMVPLLIGISLCFFPETPKYLIEDGQEMRAIKVLQLMYAENTRNPRENYPVESITNNEEHLSEKSPLLLNGNAGRFVVARRTGTARMKKDKELKKMLIEMIRHMVTIFKPPYLLKTFLCASIQFTMTSSYYTLMAWFPELFRRFAEFEEKYPGESASICTVSESDSSNNTISDIPCDMEIRNSVYYFTFFLGLACVPTSIWLPLCIGKLGYRFFLVFSTVVSACVALAMFFIASSTQNIILSCIFEALTSMGVSVVYCILVDFYPTHLRWEFS